MSNPAAFPESAPAGKDLPKHPHALDNRIKPVKDEPMGFVLELQVLQMVFERLAAEELFSIVLTHLPSQRQGSVGVKRQLSLDPDECSRIGCACFG